MSHLDKFLSNSENTYPIFFFIANHSKSMSERGKQSNAVKCKCKIFFRLFFQLRLKCICVFFLLSSFTLVHQQCLFDPRDLIGGYLS